MTNLALRQEGDEQERRRLGDRLREARKYLGLKQEEVAAYLKIPRTALTDIENGQRRVEAIELDAACPSLPPVGGLFYRRRRGLREPSRRCRPSGATRCGLVD